MMVTFISQCEKKALNRTRRVLDAYANRIGDNVWQTIITEEGLLMVKKLLRRTASKNTAVSCHWIRSRSRSDLLWVVGNRNRFNEMGYVPVNYTEANIEQFMDHEQWQSLEVMKSAVAIAGLFHDIGKANTLFQAKLRGESKNRYEPVRHEWVSLRIFQAFVGDCTDEEWLLKLAEIEKNHQDQFFKDGISQGRQHPLKDLPPFAQLVGWLIVSHHKLPVVPSWKKTLVQETRPKKPDKNSEEKKSLLETWFDIELSIHWNSYNFKDEDSPELYEDNWKIHAKGLPYKSYKWRLKAIKFADQALQALRKVRDKQQNLLHDELFTTHISRMVLMLADHFYSATPEVTNEWRASDYEVYANTDRDTGELKQQLDEHLIGVAHNALEIMKALPRLKRELNTIEDNDFLKSHRTVSPKYAWQIKAQKVAQSLRESSVKQGFFGINMASTGKGKTLANAKIMYALADKEQDCRFTVALGLRTLTLQTGKEYRKLLGLTDAELAIAVGGVATKALFENSERKKKAEEEFSSGSESAEDFLDPNLFLDYEVAEVEHSLHLWTKNNKRIEKLIQAPALVCTIDHLMPATEGTQGGKQIGPMLRLLTSDLVIDEPDDFDLKDLPALCRLVYWAGMLGSRVLLSTATISPDLAYATFLAYQKGWTEYAKTNVDNWNEIVNCAFFDERDNGAVSCEVKDFNTFRTNYDSYVNKRVQYLLENLLVKHKGKILENLTGTGDIYHDFAQTILQGVLQLHQDNHTELKGKKISIGLVRMANIDPLVAVAKHLIQEQLPVDTHIHLAVYHSRYPLAVRSYLEEKLDGALNRKDDWPTKEMMELIEQTDASQQIFLVLASPVAEVGRDHDYDWAVVEPSSMRSIIQIAGRILRHRDILPQRENILLINQNIKSLKGSVRCFNRPGFEVEHLEIKLNSHHLLDILEESQYQNINAIERVEKQTRSDDNLGRLEHKALFMQLFRSDLSASLWWKEQAHWSAVLQKRQPFRESVKDEALYLLADDHKLYWQWLDESVYPPKMGAISGAGIEIVEEEEPPLSIGFSFWFDLNPFNIYQQLAQDFNVSLEEISRRFGEIRLVSYKKNDINQYRYMKNFGIYREVIG